MKVTENSTYRLMQSNINKITTELENLRVQGSTGLKLLKASDDPGSIQPVLTTRTQIRVTDRYIETMGITSDKMDSTDGYLEQVEDILQRVKEIAVNAVNDSLSQEDLDVLADEVENLREQLLDAANATVDGKYIFSGYQENTIPFVENPEYDPDLWDADNPNTWPYIYQGDAYATELEITPGEYIEVNLTGLELFMGISNETVQSGDATEPPLTGIQQGGDLSLPATGDITIDIASTPATSVTITQAELNAATDNYAAQMAGLLDGSTNGVTTGLSATVSASESSVSGTFVPTTSSTDSFTVNGETLVSGACASAAVFDANLESYISSVADSDASLAGGSIADGDAWFTDANGNVINISGSATDGDLSFSNDEGANITVTESVANASQGFTSASYANSSETTYGQIEIGTNTTDDVTISGAGLAAAGLTADTLDGATAYAPDDGYLDIFSVLVRTEEALRAGNIDDEDGAGGGVSAQIDNLETAAEQSRRQRSQLGNKASRVESALEYQEEVKTDLEQILSRYQDADIIEVFNDIVSQETVFQAALNVTSRISQISILDYF